MIWFGEEQVEFRPVELEPVDLTMLKFERPKDCLGRVKAATSSSEPIVRGEWPVHLEPILKRAGGNLDVRSFAHDPLGVGEGGAQIKGGD